MLALPRLELSFIYRFTAAFLFQSSPSSRRTGDGLRSLLAADKGQEARVDRVGVGGKHAMREAWVELQSGILEELDLEQSSALVRNDLVVVPLHDERWHIDVVQVLSQVCFRERLDTVVMSLGPAHHALAPPILDDAV